MDLEAQPKMVGREKELAQLKTFLDKARRGNGNAVFIAGEAGVGKTRLLEELNGYALEQGVDVLQGWSLSESLTPYMPFLEALRSGGLESLFADEVPRIEAIYLVSHSGLSIEEVIREETKLDPDIFSGMLTAVGNFVQDSLSMLTGTETEGSLNSLGYENYRILIESMKNVNLVVILTGKENEFLVNDMKEVLVNVDRQYGAVLKEWDGNKMGLHGLDSIMERLITSGKYDGIDYAKDDPKIKRNRLFENIFLGIERNTKVNPSLLCIEDLQWADPSSLALLHYVARNTRKCNLLILGTYRPEDVSTTKDGEIHHLIEAMQMMSREDLIQKIEIERLEEFHMDMILTSILGNNDLTNDFKKQLFIETEGNPFFIISLIQMLIKENTIDEKDGVWILTKDLNEAKIPSKIRDVIVRRLNRVDKENKEILEYAAIIGEEFTSEILTQATNHGRIEVLKELRDLEQNHKLIRSIDPKYKFDHAKIKEVLYSNIPAALRTEYHTIIAQSIETLNKDNLDDAIGDLAYHYYRSRNKVKALPYLLNAAEKAKRDYSSEEAIGFYNLCIELEENPQNRITIFNSLGDIYDSTGNFNKSIESYEYALELIEDKKMIAGIKAKIGRIHERKGDYDGSIKICNEALELVKDKGCKEEALAHYNLGIDYMWKGEYDKALKHCLKSLEIRKKINDYKGISQSLNAIGIVEMNVGDLDKALDYYQKGLDISEKIDSLSDVVKQLMNIGIVLQEKKDFDKALEYYEKSLKISEKTGNQLNTERCLHNMGHMFSEMGEHDKALEHLEKSLKISEQNGEKGVAALNYHQLAIIHLEKKDIKKALDLSAQSLALSKEIGYKENIANSRQIYGMIYREQKKWKESMINFEESIRIYKDIGMEKEFGDATYEYGLMWKEKGDIDQANKHLFNARNIYEKLNLEKHVKKIEEILIQK
jgi:tetratricopeptide (TPR) repeat protein